MNRFLAIGIAAALVASPVAVPVADAAPIAPDAFIVGCRLLDPVTREAKTQALPGESILVIASVKVGSNRFGNPLNIVASARAKVAGINLKARIGEATLEVPAAAERAELIETYGNGSPPPTEYANKVESVFTVPDRFPQSTARITIVATLPGIAERTCSKSLEVL